MPSGETAERLLVRSESDVPVQVSGNMLYRAVFDHEEAGFESSLNHIRRNTLHEGQVNESHVHEDVEKVYYMLQGNAEVECGPWKRRVKAGDFVFFPASIAHSIRSLGPGDLEFIFCAAKTLGLPRGLGEPA